MSDRTGTVTLYGLSTCDTCKAALRALQRAGREVVFRDVRSEPLSDAEIAEIVREFGDRVVNRQSTTWRGFNDFLKAAETEAQLAAQPAVMKRPVIRDGARWHLGWDKHIEDALTG
jgi:arsenate reductase-like glutaredoxin family protein